MITLKHESRINEKKGGIELHINIAKLKVKVKESNYDAKELMKLIGFDQEKCKKSIDYNFTIKQANDIVEVLNLTKDDAMSIFFPHFVA